MSEYENYDDISRHYDKTREPVGIQILLGCFASSGTPLAEMEVLDAGCGTGSYALEIAEFVGQVVGVDVSGGMLREARQRAEGSPFAERISFRSASIDALPFSAGSFDAVMVNQVLHHFEEDVANLDRHRATMSEFARVLRCGGALVINTCSTDQLRDGWWYRDLFRGPFDRLAKRHIQISVLTDLLRECGFLHRGNIVPTDAVFQGESYFEPKGPLRKEWRDLCFPQHPGDWQ